MENNEIIWKEEMSVGVKEIDDQHKIFVAMISDLYSAIYKNEVEIKLKGIITKLQDYASMHFATEEKYFDKFNYEFSTEHKQKHKELTEKILTFNENFKEKSKDIAIQLADFLIDWLVDHLETDDKKYTKCFNENGLY